MTAYEKEVIKAFLNEAFGQLSAEVDGQTIIPGYADTDSSYPGNLSEEDYVTYKVSTYGRNRGYIAILLLTMIQRAGEIAVNNQDEPEAKLHYYDGLIDMTMEQLDIIFKGE